MPKKAAVKKGKKKAPRQKKVKDPNAPKKGMTAFLHYAQAKRQLFKEEFPKLTHKQIISKLGETWNKLSAKEKEPFEEKAKQDKVRYEDQKADYELKNKKTSKEKGTTEESVEKKN